MKYLSALLLTVSMAFAIEVGEIPKTIVLQNDTGGLLDGKPFSTESIKGKVHVLFYVDPDEKDMNEHVSAGLKEQELNSEHFASIAIINMAATWLPNFAIASSLEEKQEKYPDTIYVKDLESVLVKEWDLKDDSSNVVLFDKQGKVLFIKKGKLSEEEMQTLFSLIQY